MHNISVARLWNDRNPVRWFKKNNNTLVPWIGGKSGSFHLNLPSATWVFVVGVLIRWHSYLPQVTGRPITQLTSEMAELVAAVTMSSGLRSRHYFGATQIVWRKWVLRDLIPVEPEQGQSFVGHRHQPSIGQWLRLDSGETRSFHLSHPGLLGGV